MVLLGGKRHCSSEAIRAPSNTPWRSSITEDVESLNNGLESENQKKTKNRITSPIHHFFLKKVRPVFPDKKSARYLFSVTKYSFLKFVIKIAILETHHKKLKNLTVYNFFLISYIQNEYYFLPLLNYKFYVFCAL